MMPGCHMKICIMHHQIFLTASVQKKLRYSALCREMCGRRNSFPDWQMSAQKPETGYLKPDSPSKRRAAAKSLRRKKQQQTEKQRRAERLRKRHRNSSTR